ncbi:MAG TPA: SUMF1/EgtB/PvdO family nonheme iron enzyme [Pyrinomonadaceae bacterium]|jgi:formylglycine-generating enzyme required for sulfatase activity
MCALLMFLLAAGAGRAQTAPAAGGQEPPGVRPRRVRPPMPEAAVRSPKPEETPAQHGQVDELYRSGLVSYKQGRYEDAVRYFKQVVGLNPQRTMLALAHFHLGNAHSELGQHREAVAEFNEVIRLNPRDDVALNNLGVAHNELGAYKDALSLLKQSLQLKADAPVVLYNEGVVYYNLAMYSEAAEAYRRALSLQPDFAETAYYNLGLVYQNMGRYEQATEAYQQAVRLSPDFPEARFNLGRLYALTGNKAAAGEQYSLLQKLEPALAERLDRLINPPAPARPTKEEGAAAGAFKPEMVMLRGGIFQMGRSDVSPLNVNETNQYPAHPVTVAPFYMDKTEVTNAEYADFVRQTGHAAPPHWLGQQPPAGEERWPVTNVSLGDAQAFAAWRSKRDGVEYRLPTEEEWEYAGRGGGAYKLYPWGNEAATGRANVNASSPQSVGSFPQGASKDGVLDLIGNVWEWTSSKNSLYPGNDAAQLEDGAGIITRGGGYSSKAGGEGAITATRRKVTRPDTRHPTLGFRLVRAAQ